MALDRITLENFRNHRQSAIVGARRFNLLVGDNGAGKTNALEALSLLAPGRGLRRARLAEMARRDGPGGFALGASLIEQGHESARLGSFVEAEGPTRSRLRRRARINREERALSDLGEWLWIGWLTPAMDGLFTDSAGARRRFLDRLTLALAPDHARQLAGLEKALRERARLLEEGRSEPRWLDAIEAQIAQHGARVTQARRATLDALEGELAGFEHGPFARPRLALAAGGPSEETPLREALGQSRARDRAAGRALTGPQRDELVVTMAAGDVSAAQASTGQQKAMLIAITLAHARLASRGRPSVLLLDEIAAHLDAERRAALFDHLRATGAQIWMSATETAPFDPIGDELAAWRVREGAIEPL